jgi:hypothetical protein
MGRIESIARQTKELGFVLILKALSAEVVAKLRSEFDEMISDAENLPYKADRHDGAVCIRVWPRDSLSSTKYPLTAAFFNMDVFKRIAEKFYSASRSDIVFNDEIFVHETPDTKEPLSMKLHWDRVQTLKFRSMLMMCSLRRALCWFRRVQA